MFKGLHTSDPLTPTFSLLEGNSDLLGRMDYASRPLFWFQTPPNMTVAIAESEIEKQAQNTPDGQYKL